MSWHAGIGSVPHFASGLRGRRAEGPLEHDDRGRSAFSLIFLQALLFYLRGSVSWGLGLALDRVRVQIRGGFGGSGRSTLGREGAGTCMPCVAETVMQMDGFLQLSLLFQRLLFSLCVFGGGIVIELHECAGKGEEGT